MICKVIGDSTEKLVHHDDYDHYGVRKQSYLNLAEQLQNWGHRSKLRVPWQHYQLIVKFKTTLDCSFNGRLTILLSTFSRAFDSETRTGRLYGRNRLRQVFHLTDFNNIRNANSLLSRGLSNNRRRDTRHTKPSLRSVPSILPANHDNIIRPF